jgi:hypothetical protein
MLDQPGIEVEAVQDSLRSGKSPACIFAENLYHESAIVTILQRVMDVIDPPTLPDPPRRRIGFGVDEGAGVRSQRRCGR